MLRLALAGLPRSWPNPILTFVPSCAAVEQQFGPDDFLCDVVIITQDAGSLGKRNWSGVAILSIRIDADRITCYMGNSKDVRPWG
jgi:hypothetical protein